MYARICLTRLASAPLQARCRFRKRTLPRQHRNCTVYAQLSPVSTCAPAVKTYEQRVGIQAAPLCWWDEAFAGARASGQATFFERLPFLTYFRKLRFVASFGRSSCHHADQACRAGLPGYVTFQDIGEVRFRSAAASSTTTTCGEAICYRQGQVSFSDLALAVYPAASRSAARSPPLPERLLRWQPRALHAWRHVVLRWNAWRRRTTEARRRVVGAGQAGVASMLLCDATFYTAAFLALWLGMGTPRGLGLLGTCHRLAEVFALMYVGSQATKLPRTAGMLALAPLVDSGMRAAQSALGLHSKQAAFELLLICCLTLWLGTCAAIVALWA